MKRANLRLFWCLAAGALIWPACNDDRSAPSIPDATIIGADASDGGTTETDGGLPEDTDVPDTPDPTDTDISDTPDPDVRPDVAPDVIEDIGPDVNPEGCGDGVIDEDEECDDGEANSDEDPDACRTDCTFAYCGDGVIDSEEECDDGEANSDLDADACRTDCSLPFCGDGVVDDGESCDDGNDTDDDFCSNTCNEVLGSLCLGCDSDDECGGDNDLCSALDNGDFCTVGCESDDDCPASFTCTEVEDAPSQCFPDSGSCEGCLDDDDDGYGIGPECSGFDCNEDDETINAGAVEVCDGFDNDCDGQTDEGDAEDALVFYADRDGDGFGDPTDSITACEPTDVYFVEDGTDCDDDDANVYPDAPELCDGVINACDTDGVAEDGADDPDVGVECDGDDADLCALGSTICVDGAIMCDDVASDDTLELCDGEDNDCNPDTPDGADEDGIGAGCDGDDEDECASGILVCDAGALLCEGDDGASEEICDGLDNDCDGEIDNDPVDAADWYSDEDADGFGAGEAFFGCEPDDGTYALTDGDCDDTDPESFPGGIEVCDGADNDCNDIVDDEPEDGVVGFTDSDGDGYGADDSGVLVCELGDLVEEGGDCDDTLDIVNPASPEICDDGLDNDCDDAMDCLDGSCASADVCADLDCIDEDLGSAIGAEVAVGTNTGAGNDFEPDCISRGGGEEVFYAWTAPSAGTYFFDTTGSDYDTSLYALTPNCASPEQLACNDDIGGGSLQSRISLDAEAGQTYIIGVDAWGTNDGDYTLNITQAEVCDDGEDNDGDGDTDCDDSDCSRDGACLVDVCVAEDIGSDVGLAAATGATDDGDDENNFASDCGGASAAEDLLLWTAPESATYTFNVGGSAYDAAVYLLPPDCSGAPLDCGPSPGPFGGESTATAALEAGESIIVVIDGISGDTGDYLLGISVDEAGFCDDGVDNDDDGDTDCADDECIGTPACVEVCDDGEDNDLDGDVDCADEDCFGEPVCAEICDDGEDNDFDGDTDCDDEDCAADGACLAEVCTPEDIGSVVSLAASTGATDDADDENNFASDCGGASSNEELLLWTAPETANYTFDVGGSAYEAAVYLLPIDCSGEPVACGPEPGPFPGSGGDPVVNATLEAGESIIIVVDGVRGDEGDYLLGIGADEAGFCDDGVDNDDDGDMDCADEDCDGSDACVEICDDMEDNDADSDVDCADSECTMDEFCCVPDVFEPNQGSTGEPSTVYEDYLDNRDAELTISSVDDDFFRIPIECEDSEITITASFAHDEGNIDLALLVNAGGRTFTAASGESETDDEEITWTPADLPFPFTPDFAFLRVRMEDVNTCSDYTLSIDVDNSGC